MDILLYKKDNMEFRVTDKFSSKMLTPIIKNLISKAENNWDDYNEVYHCCNLIESVKKNPKMKMDFHYLLLDDNIVGIALLTYGEIDKDLFFPSEFELLDKIEDIVIFNYFHISNEGRGNGEIWLKDIIFRYYRKKKFKVFYLKSSHKKVFSLYSRLGEEIGEYIGKSDNDLYKRIGKIFKIQLIV